MNEREEEPLVGTICGQEQLRDWRNRRHCGDPVCIAKFGEPYCIQDSPADELAYALERVGAPVEAAEGVGAVVIDSGTLDTPEFVGDSLDAVNFELKTTEDGDITWKELTKIKTGRRESRVEYLVKTFKEPVRHPRIRGCGHKFEPLRQPKHSNCESCWNAFFWNQNEFTENLAKNLTEQGPEIIQFNYGKKFLTAFLKFARLLAAYEMAKTRAATDEAESIRLQAEGESSVQPNTD
jgi:hypothetical protein